VAVVIVILKMTAKKIALASGVAVLLQIVLEYVVVVRMKIQIMVQVNVM
jgi:hypothetical protein